MYVNFKDFSVNSELSAGGVFFFSL